MTLTRLLIICTVFALLPVTAGCGNGAPYPKQQVRGQVMYEDGSRIPATQITLRFESLEPAKDPKTHPRTGIGYTDDQGYFDTVTTDRYADGIIRGRHKVLLAATGSGDVQLIPDEYFDVNSTPLEISSDDSPFELHVKMPE